MSKNCYILCTVDPFPFPTETLVMPDIAIAFQFLKQSWSCLILTKTHMDMEAQKDRWPAQGQPARQ